MRETKRGPPKGHALFQISSSILSSLETGCRADCNKRLGFICRDAQNRQNQRKEEHVCYMKCIFSRGLHPLLAVVGLGWDLSALTPPSVTTCLDPPS